MSDGGFTESVVEQAALAWLESVGWQVAQRRRRSRRASRPPSATTTAQVVLDAAAARRAGAAQSDAARRGARRRLPQADAPRRRGPRSQRNRALHRLLVDGVTVEYRDADGAIRGAQARVIDFDDPTNNDWLAVNQFTVVENKHKRRPDVVLFVNGLPLAVIELKNAADENATIWTRLPAAPDLQGRDPVAVRVQRAAGRLRRRRGPRRHARRRARVVQAVAHHRRRGAGRHAPAGAAGRDRGRLRHRGASSTWCATSSSSRTTAARVVKKMAGYHQFHAVQVAVGETLRAAQLARGRRGRRTQGATRRAATGRQARRPARRRGLAHAGLGQEPDDGLLRRAHHPRAGDGEPDHRRAHRPQRPRRPALRHLLALPGAAAPDAGAGREPRAPARAARAWRRAASSSPRSRSSSPRRRATGTRCSPSGATSW